MQFSRAIFPLLLILLLFFAQQGGAMHALHPVSYTHLTLPTSDLV